VLTIKRTLLTVEQDTRCSDEVITKGIRKKRKYKERNKRGWTKVRPI